jgi:hypothetical protein
VIIAPTYRIDAAPGPWIVVETSLDLEAVDLADTPAEPFDADAYRDRVAGWVRGFRPRLEASGWAVRVLDPPADAFEAREDDAERDPLLWLIDAAVWRPTMAEAAALAADLEAAIREAVARVEADRKATAEEEAESKVEAEAEANRVRWKITNA